MPERKENLIHSEAQLPLVHILMLAVQAALNPSDLEAAELVGQGIIRSVEHSPEAARDLLEQIERIITKLSEETEPSRDGVSET